MNQWVWWCLWGVSLGWWVWGWAGKIRVYPLHKSRLQHWIWLLQIHSFSLHIMLNYELNIRRKESHCGLLVLSLFYLVLLLDSFWRHPFTADDPLVNNWCDAKFLQICFNEETNSWMSWRSANFQFEWTIPVGQSASHICTIQTYSILVLVHNLKPPDHFLQRSKLTFLMLFMEMY